MHSIRADTRANSIPQGCSAYTDVKTPVRRGPSCLPNLTAVLNILGQKRNSSKNCIFVSLRNEQSIHAFEHIISGVAPIKLK